MRALIAMSGGVDSSAAAYLMQKEGYDCAGATMKLWDGSFAPPDGAVSDRACCTVDDAEAARSVAVRLGMPFYVFNFSDEFRRDVICPFVEAYARGETPNPCIDCNRFLKFGRLLGRAAELGYDVIATGHYAVTDRDPETGLYRLKRAADAAKDLEELRANLARQVSGSVRWEGCLRRAVAAGADTVIEFGPGAVLTGLAKRTLPGLKLFNINSVEALNAF